MSFFKKLFGKKKQPTPTQAAPVIEPSPKRTPEPVQKEVIEEKPIEPTKEVILEPVQKEVIEEKPIESTKEVILEPVLEASKPEPILEAQPVIVEKTNEPISAAPPAKEEKATNPKPGQGRYSGKFEVFPEAGFFKYRLKASNGEILVVSSGYTTKNGAINGIETLKKNAEIGQYEIVTDKNKFTQFQLFNANGSRVIVTGEFYETVARAESALESFKKFVSTERIDELQEIDPSEIREELVQATQVEPKSNGKIEIVKEDKTVRAVLKASNGEILFSTTPYATKASLLSGLESIKKAVESNNFRVSKDKQGRYQFVLYSSNNQVLIAGETYKTKEAVLSVIDSVKRFLFQAKVIE